MATQEQNIKCDVFSIYNVKEKKDKIQCKNDNNTIIF